MNGVLVCVYMGVSKNSGIYPKTDGLQMENSINPWMIWGKNPYFWKHPGLFITCGDIHVAVKLYVQFLGVGVLIF